MDQTLVERMLSDFSREIVTSIKDAEESSGKSSFDEGKMLSLLEVSLTLVNRAKSFGVDLDKTGLSNIERAIEGKI